MDPVDRVRSIVEPLLSALGLELFDVELKAGILRISVDKPAGQGGLDLDAISLASQRVSEALDADDPIEGRYTLEVSSPGLERPLRTPAHFRRYVGTTVSVKTRPDADTDGERRIEDTLEAADDEGITIAGRRIAYADIDRARTVFEWGGQPKKNAKNAKKKAAS